MILMFSAGWSVWRIASSSIFAVSSSLSFSFLTAMETVSSCTNAAASSKPFATNSFSMARSCSVQRVRSIFRASA